MPSSITAVGFFFNDSGAALQNVAMSAFKKNTTSGALATDTTDVNGRYDLAWIPSDTTETTFDIRGTSGTSIFRGKWDDQIYARRIVAEDLRMKPDRYFDVLFTAAPTAERTITFPDATDTVAMLGVANVFTVDQAFNEDILIATGKLINWASGDVTLTHSTGKLTWGGDGAVEIDFANHEMTNVDIDSGTIDDTPIGAGLAATGTFSTLIGTTIDGPLGSVTPAAIVGTTITGDAIVVGATERVHFDGSTGGDTYIYEESADDLHIVVGGTTFFQIDQDLVSMGVGPTAAPSTARGIIFGGAYTTTNPAIAEFTIFSGQLTSIPGNVTGMAIFRGNGVSITQTATESIANISQIQLTEPDITNNLTGGGVVTRANTLYIDSVPTEGNTANNGIYMPAGAFEVSDGQGTAGEQLASGGADGNLSWTTASSVRENKKGIKARTNDDKALAMIVNTPVYDFKYRKTQFRTTITVDPDTGKTNTVREPIPGKRIASTGDYETDYVGIMADEAPQFMHYEGRTLNPINTFGYTVQAFKALVARIRELEAA